MGIYFLWCYWTDLESLKGVLRGVRDVDIASSLWRVASASQVLLGSAWKQEGWESITVIICGSFEKPLWNVSGVFDGCWCVSGEAFRGGGAKRIDSKMLQDSAAPRCQLALAVHILPSLISDSLFPYLFPLIYLYLTLSHIFIVFLLLFASYFPSFIYFLTWLLSLCISHISSLKPVSLFPCFFFDINASMKKDHSIQTAFR